MSLALSYGWYSRRFVKSTYCVADCPMSASLPAFLAFRFMTESKMSVSVVSARFPTEAEEPDATLNRTVLSWVMSTQIRSSGFSCAKTWRQNVSVASAARSANSASVESAANWPLKRLGICSRLATSSRKSSCIFARPT